MDGPEEFRALEKELVQKLDDVARIIGKWLAASPTRVLSHDVNVAEGQLQIQARWNAEAGAMPKPLPRCVQPDIHEFIARRRAEEAEANRRALEDIWIGAFGVCGLKVPVDWTPVGPIPGQEVKITIGCTTVDAERIANSVGDAIQKGSEADWTASGMCSFGENDPGAEQEIGFGPYP